MNGKGDKYRPVDREKWDKEYDRIYSDQIKKARAGYKKENVKWNTRPKES